MLLFGLETKKNSQIKPTHAILWGILKTFLTNRIFFIWINFADKIDK